MDKTRTYASHPAAFIDQPVATPHQPRFAQQLFDFGMIATGNQNFERFAALCNTPGGSQELRNRWSLPFNEPLSCVSFGSPYWRPLQGVCKIGSAYRSTYYTPSASLRSAAPPEVEPRTQKILAYSIPYRFRCGMNIHGF